jgi:hypothetical protein
LSHSKKTRLTIEWSHHAIEFDAFQCLRVFHGQIDHHSSVKDVLRFSADGQGKMGWNEEREADRVDSEDESNSGQSSRDEANSIWTSSNFTEPDPGKYSLSHKPFSPAKSNG